jgi:hypothetical protein
VPKEGAKVCRQFRSCCPFRQSSPSPLPLAPISASHHFDVAHPVGIFAAFNALLIALSSNRWARRNASSSFHPPSVVALNLLRSFVAGVSAGQKRRPSNIKEPSGSAHGVILQDLVRGEHSRVDRHFVQTAGERVCQAVARSQTEGCIPVDRDDVEVPIKSAW